MRNPVSKPNATLIIFILVIGCNNYDLQNKLEVPGSGRAGNELYVVNHNIPADLSTGGSFLASVTFNRPVNLTFASIFITNGASISALASPDNQTWTFTITFGSVGSHVLTLSGVTDSTGYVMQPFGFSFNVNFA